MVEFQYSMPEKREKEETMKRKNSKAPLEENEIVCPSCEEEEEVIKKEKMIELFMNTILE